VRELVHGRRRVLLLLDRQHDTEHPQRRVAIAAPRVILDREIAHDAVHDGLPLADHDRPEIPTEPKQRELPILVPSGRMLVPSARDVDVRRAREVRTSKPPKAAPATANRASVISTSPNGWGMSARTTSGS
jgi:hypothetical protein